MNKKPNTSFIQIAKCVIYLLLVTCVALGCYNNGGEQASIRDFDQRKRAEAFISKLDMPHRLELLLLETKGDTTLLAKLLMAPEASIKRLMAEETQPTVYALKKTSRTFADIKEFDAETIINAALKNKEILDVENNSLVWEKMEK